MTDGLPVVPPTREKVEYYLQYTTYAATDIVNTRNGEVQDVPPANREILAYQVAVNAIMAGCRRNICRCALPSPAALQTAISTSRSQAPTAGRPMCW